MRGQPRRYRHVMGRPRLETFRCVVQQTDLWIQAHQALQALTRETVLMQRAAIETYVSRYPDFVHSLVPWPMDEFAPPIVRTMIHAGRAVGVGPMAAVAGAIAAAVGQRLLSRSPEVVVENGGDIFLRLTGRPLIAVSAGRSPLSMRVGLRLPPCERPVAVCTSSGTVGHSLSLGRADAVTVFADDCALADAAATAIGNRVGRAADISAALAFARQLPDLRGVLVIVADRLGAWGELEVVPLNRKKS
jgi:hypothetical protein